MAQQRFRALTPFSDPLFTEKVRLTEFIRDLSDAFGRKLNLMTTTSGLLVITLDADIPDSDGTGNIPYFDPAYYGLERI